MLGGRHLEAFGIARIDGVGSPDVQNAAELELKVRLLFFPRLGAGHDLIVRIRMRRDLVVGVAQPRNERQPVVEQRDLILQIDVGTRCVGIGEVEAACHRDSRCVGGEIVGDVDPFIFGFYIVAIEAVGERVRYPADTDARSELNIRLVEGFGVFEAVEPLFKIARGQKCPPAIAGAVDVLRRPGKLPIESIEPDGADIPLLVERDTPAFDILTSAITRLDIGCGSFVGGILIDIGPARVILARETELVSFRRRPHEFCQHIVRSDVLRIEFIAGCGEWVARTGRVARGRFIARGPQFRFVRVPPRDGEKRFNGVGCFAEAKGAGDRLDIGIVERAIGCRSRTRDHVVRAPEIVGRILRDEIDHTAKTVGAPENGRGATDDFHGFHVARVDDVARIVGDALDGARTVHDHLRAVAAHASDLYAAGTVERIRSADLSRYGNAGLVTEELLDCVVHSAVELLRRDARDISRCFKKRARGAICRHRDWREDIGVCGFLLDVLFVTAGRR